MKPTEIIKQRYTTKVFDPGFSLSPEQVQEIKTLLQFTPSSTNSQPWHFFITGSAEGKERIAKAATGRYEYNALKIKNASHVVILCSRTDIDGEYLQLILDTEEKDGRFIDDTAKKMQHAARSSYADLHRDDLKDIKLWTVKQVYLALGVLLFGAGMMGIDACPMEGFDSSILDRELGLDQKGFCSAVIVSLGRHADTDFNKNLPKSRLPEKYLFTEI